MKKHILPLCLLAAFSLTPSLHAASIAFSTPQTAAGDSDVLTTGSLVYAYTQFMQLANPTQTFTVNGVTFAPGNSATSLGAGNITLTGFTTTVINLQGINAPYANLSTAYKFLFRGGSTAPGNTVCTVTLNNLTLGQTYMVQLWVGDAINGANRNELVRNIDDSGAVTLDFNSTDTALAGVGQYTIGTFTADAISQSFEMVGANQTLLDSIQLRAVPEPSVALLGGLGTLALLRRRR